MMKECPKYLKGYEDIWKKDPRVAGAWQENPGRGISSDRGVLSKYHKGGGGITKKSCNSCESRADYINTKREA